MSYNELITLIDACINRNGVQAITGRVLNGVLKAMVNQLGAGYALGGVAHPADDPGTPEAPVCYFASEVGTYTDFGGLTIAAGELALLCYDLTDGWFKETMYDGFQVVNATVDANVGTPDVNVTYNNGVLSFAFENLKGNTGDAAGFGNITASVDDQIGTPSVAVTESGPNTAKNLAFAFHNLKGETGVTSVVVTVDNTTGTPQCAVSLSGQQLTLAFTGLKGAQGDTGVSADYPITIVNNLTTNDPTSALSAAMGVQLESEVSQLEAKVDEKFHAPDTEVGTFEDGYFNTNADTLPASRNTLSGCKSAKISVTPGQLYKIYGEALNNNYYRFYAFYDADGNRIDRYSSSGIYRDTPLDVTVPANAVTMVVNLGNYASATDKVIIPGEEYSFQEIVEAIEQTDENVANLTTALNGVESKTETLESSIIEGATVTVKGLSTSNLVLNNAIELSQDGDEVEIQVANIDAYSDWFSFSNSGVGSNSYYAIALSRASIDIRATDGEWICGTTSIPYADKHTVKVVYSSGNIYTYVDGSLVHTYTGQKTIRISSFGNGGNGTYGYWKGTIVSIKHNTVNIALYEQQANDATVAYVYRFVKWSDISGLDVLPAGVLKYDSTNKVFDFFNRYGKTDKYFSFRVRLNENNSDLVYLKEWRLSEGKVWSYSGGNFTEIAQTIYDAENEMAMRFVNTADYTGGIHGDERIDVSPLSFVKFFVDGRLITAEEMQNDFSIECSSFCYMQLSTLHETSATAETFVAGHPIVAYHYKRNTFEDCASRLENVIKFASQQTVTQYHAGMMCVGKGAGLYAILPGMVETPELSGTNDDYDADDISASRVEMWNPVTGVRCYVDGVLTQGIENTDIQQFEVWDRTTDSKYYRRMVKGDSVAPVFEAGEFIRNEQTIKFY